MGPSFVLKHSSDIEVFHCYYIKVFYKVFAEMVVCIVDFILFPVLPFVVFFLMFFDSFCSCIFVWIIFSGIFESLHPLFLGLDWLSLDHLRVLLDSLIPNLYQYSHQLILVLQQWFVCLLLRSICHFLFLQLHC